MGRSDAERKLGATMIEMEENNKKKPLYPDFIVDPRTVAFSDPSYRGVLPHLEKPGCTYFVTYCLADVAPRRAAERGRNRESNDPVRIAKESDLEPTAGECVLKDPGLAAIVEDALLHFQGERYLLSAWCVMPNHVHAIVTPIGDHALSRILQSWKGYTGLEINRRLNRSGPVWQREAFDHIVRSPDAFEGFVTYIENNPIVAGLVAKPTDWKFSSARHRKSL